MKVEADRSPADREALDQNAADEFLRGKACQRRVESQYDRTVEPGGGEQPQFSGLIGQPKQRFGGLEEGTRMRLQGQRRGRTRQRLGAIERRRDDGFMAAMDAIEIADRVICRVIGRTIAHDAETLRHLDYVGLTLVRACDG